MNDDADSVAADYAAPEGPVASIWYGLTTSLGMIGLIVAMVGGVLACVICLAAGLTAETAVLLGLASALVIFLAMVAIMGRAILRSYAKLEARFPAPPDTV